MSISINMLIGVVIIFYVNLAAMHSEYASYHPAYAFNEYEKLVQRIIACHKNPPLGQQQVLMNYLMEKCDIMLERQPSSYNEVQSFWKKVQEIRRPYPQSIVEDVIYMSSSLRDAAIQSVVARVYNQQLQPYQEKQLQVNDSLPVVKNYGVLQQKDIERALYPNDIVRSYARIKELRKLAEVAHILLHDAALEDFFSGF